MIKVRQRIIISSFLLASAFFLAGCERLKTLDREVGRFISGEILGEKQEVDTPAPAASQPGQGQSLSKEQKESIDKWLELNGFNRYGDPKDTFYAGGTPLFDEKSGQTIERYEYIMKKHPDIMSKI
jgi:hypothetical protein